MKYLLVLFCITIILISAGCNNGPSKKDPGGFHSMLQHYWIDYIKLHPLDATVFGNNDYNDQFQNTCTQAYRDSIASLNKRYRDSLDAYDISGMEENDQLSYKVLDYDLKIEQEQGKYDTWKIPFTQFGDAGNTISGNMVLAIGQFGSGSSGQPFKTVMDYDNWLKRSRGYSDWVDSAIANFRQGMSTHYVLPRALVVKMVDICRGLITTDYTKSVFYGPIKNMPDSFPDEQKRRLTNTYMAAINLAFNTPNKRLADFLQNEYLPAARISSGVDSLPDGLNYYRMCVKYWTTTDKTLDEIYNTGLSEVKRIRTEMERIKDSTGFKGDLKAFFEFMKTDKQFMPFKTPGDVLDSFRHIYEIVKPNLPKYFILFPKSRFEIRQTEAFRAASASIEYSQGSPDGSRPGVFYVPILDAGKFNVTSGMESTFLHEAVPGHHYQSSLQMEDSALPTFRRFKWYGAYGEGWALYCESLGSQLGLYTNPYQHMGALGDEIHRAIRLVVDVAIHSKGMTREQAIAYMMENEAIDLPGATAEIERYMALPGQALSYKIGALKLVELRDKYSKQLGSKFNIAEFHKQVLNSGCLPLVVLEDKLDKWAGAVK